MFGRTRQRGGRRRRVDGGADPVEVTGTDLTLVLAGGVTALLSRELALLQLDVGTHLVADVAVGQIFGVPTLDIALLLKVVICLRIRR